MDRIAYRVRCLCKTFSLNEQDAEDASQEMLTAARGRVATVQSRQVGGSHLCLPCLT